MADEIEGEDWVFGEDPSEPEPVVSAAVADPKEDMNPATRLVPFIDPIPVSDQSVTIIEKPRNQRSTIPKDEEGLRDRSASDEFEVVAHGYLGMNRCFGESKTVTRAEIQVQNRSPRTWCERGDLIPAQGVNP